MFIMIAVGFTPRLWIIINAMVSGYLLLPNNCPRKTSYRRLNPRLSMDVWKSMESRLEVEQIFSPQVTYFYEDMYVLIAFEMFLLIL